MKSFSQAGDLYLPQTLAADSPKQLRKKLLIRQHRKHGRSNLSSICSRQHGCIELCTDQSFDGEAFFNSGNHRRGPGLRLSPQRTRKLPGAHQRRRRLLHRAHIGVRPSAPPPPAWCAQESPANTSCVPLGFRHHVLCYGKMASAQRAQGEESMFTKNRIEQLLGRRLRHHHDAARPRPGRSPKAPAAPSSARRSVTAARCLVQFSSSLSSSPASSGRCNTASSTS